MGFTAHPEDVFFESLSLIVLEELAVVHLDVPEEIFVDVVRSVSELGRKLTQ